MEVCVDNGCARFGVVSGLVGANKQCNSEKTRMRIGRGKSSERQTRLWRKKSGTEQLFCPSSQSSRRRTKEETHERIRDVQHCREDSLEPNMTSQACERQARNKLPKTQSSRLKRSRGKGCTITSARNRCGVHKQSLHAACGHRHGIGHSDTAHARNISEHLGAGSPVPAQTHVPRWKIQLTSRLDLAVTLISHLTHSDTSL